MVLVLFFSWILRVYDKLDFWYFVRSNFFKSSGLEIDSMVLIMLGLYVLKVHLSNSARAEKKEERGAENNDISHIYLSELIAYMLLYVVCICYTHQTVVLLPAITSYCSLFSYFFVLKHICALPVRHFLIYYFHLSNVANVKFNAKMCVFLVLEYSSAVW